MCLFMLVEVHLLATANDKITRRLHCPLSKEACAAMHYMCAAHVGDKKMGMYSSALLNILLRGLVTKTKMLVTKRWKYIPPQSCLITLCEVRDTCMNKVWHPQVAQLRPHSSQLYSWRLTQQIAVTGSPN